MGSMFPWSTQYSVKNVEIDTQHKRLFDLINTLYEAMASGKGKEVIAPTLDKLVEYTRSHFMAEERLMQSHSYPDFKAHKAQHEAFILKVTEFQTQYQQGRLGLTVQVLNFLKDWLKEHILISDQKYTSYL